MKAAVCISGLLCVIACICGCHSRIVLPQKGSYYSLEQISNIVAACRTSQDVKRIAGQPSNILNVGNGVHMWIYDAPVDATVIDDIGGFTVDITDDGRVICWHPVYTFMTIWRDGKRYKVKSIHEKPWESEGKSEELEGHGVRSSRQGCDPAGE